MQQTPTWVGSSSERGSSLPTSAGLHGVVLALAALLCLLPTVVTRAEETLRIGASRSPGSMFRLDFACAFDPDPLGRDAGLVSFSGTQAF